jgi:hypothetical protein
LWKGIVFLHIEALNRRVSTIFALGDKAAPEEPQIAIASYVPVTECSDFLARVAAKTSSMQTM